MLYSIPPNLSDMLITYALPMTGTADLVPAALTWAAVATDAAGLIATAVVTGILSFVIGVRVVPKFVRMLKSVAR